MLFAKKGDEERFSQAILEVLRAKPVLKGRPAGRQDAAGFFRVEAYFSPHERKALAELAEERGISVSKCLRTLLRTFRTVEIDGRGT